MNVINNHDKLDLGLQLNGFRAATQGLSPKDRGLALDQFDHVRDVHNSFARYEYLYQRKMKVLTG